MSSALLVRPENLVGIMVAPGPLLKAAIDAGAQLVIVGGDIADVSTAWQKLLSSVTE